MGERRTTASEVADALMRREPRIPKTPEIRLRADTPALDITETTPITDAVAQLRDQDMGAIALREQGAEPMAVVIPVERYLELIGIEIIHGRRDALSAQAGRVMPNESVFAALHIEPVDPAADWHPRHR